MSLLLPITTRLVETRAQSVPPGLKYETAWATAIDASGPVQLAIGASHVFVADAKGGVRALAIADGRETWAKKDAAGARLAAGDGLVFAVANETLHALDEASGAVRWSAVVQGATSAPAWTTGWIVVAAGSDLFALRATDGTDGWRLQLPAALQPPVVFDGSSIVAALASRTLLAIELSTGKVQHQIPLDVDAGPLLAMGGRLFFSGSDGTVHAFKLAGDEADWRYPLRVPPIGAPAANDKCVFVTLFDNSLHALDVEIGNKCWSRSLPSRPAAGPNVAGDYVVVPLTSGGFAIINAKDGKLVANLAAAETLEAFAVSADASQVATVTIGTESRKVTLQRRDMKGMKK